MSIVQTFSSQGGLQQVLPPQHPAWMQYKQQNDDESIEVFQRAQPGQSLNSSANHVVLNQEEIASKFDMHIGDLVYYTNQHFATALNKHLDSMSAPFGPFIYISEAAVLLLQLQKRKANKAAQFRGYLDSFAAAQGFSGNLFDQWAHVMWAKDRRDLVAHPLKLRVEDLSVLKGQLADSGSPIQPMAAAVSALVKVAEELGLK